MRTLFLQSTFPPDHKNFTKDAFVSIPHIIGIDLLFFDCDDDSYYLVRIIAEGDLTHVERHPTKELAIISLKNIINIINNPAHYQFNDEVINNIRI